MRNAATLTTGAVLAAALLAGCGGGGGDEGSWNWGNAYPQSRYMTLYLRVEDTAGDPLGGASVEIDNAELGGLTTFHWYEIGYEGPPEWQGWAYNWGIEDYRTVVYSPDDVVRLDVRVSKSGWGSDSTTVEIRGDDPEHIYVRVPFRLGAYANQATQTKPQPEYLRKTTGTTSPAPRAR